MIKRMVQFWGKFQNHYVFASKAFIEAYSGMLLHILFRRKHAREETSSYLGKIFSRCSCCLFLIFGKSFTRYLQFLIQLGVRDEGLGTHPDNVCSGFFNGGVRKNGRQKCGGAVNRKVKDALRQRRKEVAHGV